MDAWAVGRRDDLDFGLIRKLRLPVFPLFRPSIRLSMSRFGNMRKQGRGNKMYCLSTVSLKGTPTTLAVLMASRIHRRITLHAR
jgi:hypothetical protein